MPTGKGSAAADGVFPRTVAHFQGATTIKTAPKRVVALSTGQMDDLVTLGIVPVGTTTAKGAGLVPAYLNAAFPEQKAALAATGDVGSRTEPNIEAIAKIKPDLILVNKAGKDSAALDASLSRIAPTVVTQGTGLYWKQDFQLVADAVGKRQEAQKWLARFHADAQAVGNRIDDATTVSFLRDSGDRTRVFGVASFPGSVAEDAGLARPESQRFTDKTSLDISTEQLALADGDRLFYSVQGGNLAALTGLDLWPTLNAVRNGGATGVDDDPFYLNAGPAAARVVLDTVESAMAK